MTFHRRPPVLVFLLAVGIATGASAAPPNVVFILADDLGWGDLHCYGHPVLKTPNLDRLAEEGTSFTQFYVTSPSCSPSRTGFLTGRYPSRSGIHRGYSSAERAEATGMPPWLDPDVVTVADRLREAGYATAHFGKWHLAAHALDDAPPPSEYGFDEFVVRDERKGQDAYYRARSTEVLVEQALGFIERHREGPFYVQLWTLVPHAHLVPTPEELEVYADLRVSPQDFDGYMRDYLAAATDLLEQMRTYAAAVTGLDRALGVLFDRLDQLGLRDDTLVVFTSDNGPSDYLMLRSRNAGVGSTGVFRGRKRSIYEGGVRVPCIVRWPGSIEAGRVDRDAVLSGLDLLPTLCALADLETVDVDGEDVTDVLLGSVRPRRAPLFWRWRRNEVGNEIYRSPPLAIRDGDWKLLTDEDGSAPELYDLRADPEERHNRAADEAGVTARLLERLLEWNATLALRGEGSSR